jgi:ribosomal protein S18 acetylase RimI-like enzyme
MPITLKVVETRKEFKDFIYLPEKIHKDHKNWMPPIYVDEKKFFNPKKNLSFRGCDYRQVIAYKDGKLVGRIMGIINNYHNEFFKLRNTRFGYMDCFNDLEVAHALLTDIENWGRQKGMKKIIGPFGFTDRDIEGFQIKGFEYEPVILSAGNLEYMPEFMVKEGYEKEIDASITRLPLNFELPEVYNRIYQRITSRKDLEFLEFTSIKQLKKYVIPVLKLTNEAYSEIYGFMPMDEKEMNVFAKQYLPLLDPRFVKIVAKGEEVIGYIVCLPNFYRGVQKSKGRLFPFGIFQILYAMKHAKRLNPMLGGVKPSYQKQGLDVFLAMKIFESAKKAGMTDIDTHLVNEQNKEMIAEFTRYGAYEIKRFRVYQKMLL